MTGGAARMSRGGLGVADLGEERCGLRLHSRRPPVDIRGAAVHHLASLGVTAARFHGAILSHRPLPGMSLASARALASILLWRSVCLRSSPARSCVPAASTCDAWWPRRGDAGSRPAMRRAGRGYQRVRLCDPRAQGEQSFARADRVCGAAPRRNSAPGQVRVAVPRMWGIEGSRREAANMIRSMVWISKPERKIASVVSRAG